MFHNWRYVVGSFVRSSIVTPVPLDWAPGHKLTWDWLPDRVRSPWLNKSCSDCHWNKHQHLLNQRCVEKQTMDYPIMHHFVTEMCTRVHISVTKRCIVGCGTGALWDSCNRLPNSGCKNGALWDMGLMHCGICVTGSHYRIILHSTWP